MQLNILLAVFQMCTSLQAAQHCAGKKFNTPQITFFQFNSEKSLITPQTKVGFYKCINVISYSRISAALSAHFSVSFLFLQITNWRMQLVSRSHTPFRNGAWLNSGIQRFSEVRCSVLFSASQIVMFLPFKLLQTSNYTIAQFKGAYRYHELTSLGQPDSRESPAARAMVDSWSNVRSQAGAQSRVQTAFFTPAGEKQSGHETSWGPLGHVPQQLGTVPT